MADQKPRPKNPAGDADPLSRTAMGVMGLVCVAALALAVFLSNPSSPGAQTAAGTGTAAGGAAQVAPTGHTTEVAVGVSGFAFTPNRIEVPAGDRLVINFTNTGDQRHDLVLPNGAESGALAPGASATLDAGVISADMEGWCSIPAHREHGMTLTITAVGAPTAGGGTDHPGHADHSGHAGHQAATGGPATAQELEEHAAAVEARDPVLPPADSATERHYTFTTTEGTIDVTDTLTRAHWTFNGTSPGPILRGRIGDTFHITLVNNGTMSHSLDFHAGLVSPDQNMRSIDPGETLEYTFTAANAGIWLYHCSTAPMSMHIANGMFGAVVIDPTDLGAVDHEYVMIANELYLGQDGQSADASLLSALQPNAMAFNGTPFQYKAHPIQVKTGERVRVWVMDAGPNLPLTYHVVGTQFDTVWREGAYVIRGGGSGGGWGQVLALGAAEGGFVEFTPLEAGHYAFVNHALSLAEKGQTGVFEVTD